MKINLTSSIFISLFIISLLYVYAFQKFSLNPPAGQEVALISSDGKGYYDYLPSIFIRKDFGSNPADGRYYMQTGQGAINKYYAGTAVAIAPFFLIAYLQQSFMDVPFTGYEFAFQLAVFLAALFYLLLGLFFLARLLHLFQISTRAIVILLFMLALATNLWVYTALSPAFSHIYSFCAISIFLYCIKKSMLDFDKALLFGASVAFGFVLLIRPFNGIVLLALPFLAGSKNTLLQFVNNVFHNKSRLALALAIVLCIALFQQFLWFVQTGKLFFWSYMDEGFYFSDPQFLKVLFSFEKGFFVYTSFFLLSFWGLYYVGKRNIFMTFSFLLFFLVSAYLISSWWNWYYGPSFGHRTFIDFYAFYCIPIAFLFSQKHPLLNKLLISAFLLFFLLLNLVQSYQYRYSILQKWDMDFEKYKYIFLKTSDKYIGSLGGNHDMAHYHRDMELVVEHSVDFENEDAFSSTSLLFYDSTNFSKSSNYINREFNTVINIPVSDEMQTGIPVHLKLEMDVMQLSIDSAQRSPLLVIEAADGEGERYFYYASKIYDIPNFSTAEWKKYGFSFNVPVKASGHIKIYVWNKHLQKILIDNIHLEIYALK